MGITEIILLILGAGVCIMGFLLPEKREKAGKADRQLGEALLKELAEAQMKDVKEKVSDAVEETITYAVEKTERSMERLTNEKIMAVNEYSDTVLEEIHKNHEEVVFLYDMLNDKHQNLKNTVVEVEKKAKDALQQVIDAEESIQQGKDAEESSTRQEKDTEEITRQTEIREESIRPAEQVQTAAPEEGAADGSEVTEVSEIKKPKKAAEKGSDPKDTFRPLAPEKTKKKAVNDKKPEKQAAEKEEKPKRKPTRRAAKADISFASSAEDGKNNNEKILALHKAGKSNMAIARELGLGIGEVKLVIDLFKGV